MEGSTNTTTTKTLDPVDVRDIPLPNGPPPPAVKCVSCQTACPPPPPPPPSRPASRKRARVEEEDPDDDYFSDPEEAEEDADYERRFMTAMFLGGNKAAPTGDITRLQIKKIVVDLGERNMSRTVAVSLLVDGRQFLLPLDFMQMMNEYELDDGEILYAPFPLWEAAGRVAEDREEDLPSNVVKAVQKKTNLPTGSPEHPCPLEKEMCIRSI